MSATKSLSIVIVQKDGSLKKLTVKDFVVEDLYKKCGFKQPDGFELQAKWSFKLDGKRRMVHMYGKTKGTANHENKYDFPPPADTPLYFGSCALVLFFLDELTHKKYPENITVELWTRIYEKLFGGFEDLDGTYAEDEAEEDELENIPKHKKTKTGGYLKDGFVVDSDEDENDDTLNTSDEEMEKKKTEDEEDDDTHTNQDGDGDLFDSELSDELYD